MVNIRWKILDGVAEIVSHIVESSTEKKVDDSELWNIKQNFEHTVGKEIYRSVYVKSLETILGIL